MPHLEPRPPIPRAKVEDDLDFPSTNRMHAMLMEHEARIKSHFDQAFERLLIAQVGIPEVTRTTSQSLTPRRRDKSIQQSQPKSAPTSPAYVRKMVEGTIKGSVGLGNSNLRSGTMGNSWSSVEQNLLRRRRLWLAYDICTMVLIFLYACFMGVNLEITTIHSKEPEWSNWIELGFCILFSADLLVRMAVEKLRFLTGPMKWWNCLDTILVSMMIVSQVTQATLISSMSGLRVLRLLRVLRIMRLARYFVNRPQFRQVRILVASIAESLKMMVWLLLIASGRWLRYSFYSFLFLFFCFKLFYCGIRFYFR